MLQQVRDSCQRICLSSPSSVKINTEKLELFCSKIKAENFAEETKDSQVNTEVNNKGIVYLAYNAVNFSFFPDSGKKRWFVEIDGKIIGKDDEAHAIVACIDKFDELNPGKLSDPSFLISLTEDKLQAIFKPAKNAGELPMLENRLIGLQCLGKFYQFLKQQCPNVDPIEALSTLCQNSVEKFVSIVVEGCPVFNDVCIYKGFQVSFFKRVQLCAAMFHSDGIIVFKDIAKLTVFADYRIPQLLYFEGVFEYSNDLQTLIQNQTFLEPKSEEETEIRAATIYAGSLITGKLRANGVEVSENKLDYFLWKTAVEKDSKKLLQPFHRCRSTFY